MADTPDGSRHDALATQVCLLEAFRCLPMGALILDRDGRVLLANEAEARLSGRVPGEIAGKDLFREVAPYDDATEVAASFRRAILEGAVDDRDLTFSGARGLDLRVRLAVMNVDAQRLAVLVVDDHSRVRSAERALSTALGKAQDQAVRDPLTGLFNRRHMELVLPGELSRAERNGTPLSILVLDVDHFKMINDRFGHPVGDRVLVELARVMNRILRIGDTCARIGGEEFCVVLPNSDAVKAGQAAERLHRVIRALRLEDETTLRLTVSIGIANARSEAGQGERTEQVQRLFARADEALYEAKRTGRDKTVVAP